MKKLARISITCLSLFVIGCSNAKHPHPIETTWTSDDKYHWHKCTEENCDYIEDKAPHNFSDIITGKQGNKYRKCYTCLVYRDIGTPGPHDGPEPGDDPEPTIFHITSEFKEEQRLYADEVNKYLLNDSSSCKVEDYEYKDFEDQGKAVTINWEADLNNSGFTLKYGKKEDLSDAKIVTLPSDITSYNFVNLEKGETYYISVTESFKGQELIDTTSFTMSDFGPRVICFANSYNVRDIGGYIVENKIGSGAKKTYRIKQNQLIRGCQIDGSNGGRDLTITEAGKKVLRDEIGIRMELDLRTKDQAGGREATGDSVLSSETLKIPYKRIDANTGSPQYVDFLNNSVAARNIIKEIIKVNEHPIYFHCQAGADRTGTLSYLIEGLLGVPENILLKDWESTTFSIFGLRSHTSNSCEFKTSFNNFVDQLKKQSGSNMQEKIENWFISSNGGGLNQNEVDAFKTFMLEEVQ